MMKRFMALIMVVLTACGGTLGKTSGTLVVPDSGITPVDVTLMGLPTTQGENDGGAAPLDPDSSGLPVLSPSNGELIVPLHQDARAPFNGVLFNGPAVARITVEFRSQQQRCMIERNHDVEVLTARYNSDIATLQLALLTQQRTDQIVIEARNGDIFRLNEVVKQQQRASSGPHIGEGLVWAAGGLVLGAAIFGGILIYNATHP